MITCKVYFSSSRHSLFPFHKFRKVINSSDDAKGVKTLDAFLQCQDLITCKTSYWQSRITL